VQRVCRGFLGRVLVKWKQRLQKFGVKAAIRIQKVVRYTHLFHFIYLLFFCLPYNASMTMSLNVFFSLCFLFLEFLFIYNFIYLLRAKLGVLRGVRGRRLFKLVHRRHVIQQQCAIIIQGMTLSIHIAIALAHLFLNKGL
jgi:hypothetical protein